MCCDAIGGIKKLIIALGVVALLGGYSKPDFDDSDNPNGRLNLDDKATRERILAEAMIKLENWLSSKTAG